MANILYLFKTRTNSTVYKNYTKMSEEWNKLKKYIRYAGTILESSGKAFDRTDTACKRLKQNLHLTIQHWCES